MQLSTAQSKLGYVKAGDESFRKHDPYNAITFYSQALAYSEDAEIQLKIGNCYREIQDYNTALLWYNRAMVKSGGSSPVYASAALGAADMQKREGNFVDALKTLNTISTTDSLYRNEIQEQLQGITAAQNLLQDTLPFSVIHTGSIINSAYSEVAPFITRDSILYFSSLRFTSGINPNINTGKILKSQVQNGQYAKPEVLPPAINHPSWNNANPSVSPDGKLMLFTRCASNEDELLICAIYESKMENGKWKDAVRLNDSINLPGTTSTQPCIVTDFVEGYKLYFSSSRKGGYGKNDIWISQRSALGKYSSPVNAGNIVNSKNDELSPYYDLLENKLYFSSDRPTGLGGYDIHAVKFVNSIPDSLFSFGIPFNSGYNDIYFSIGFSEPRQRYFASNRPPAAKMNGTSCCYDIFRLDPLPPVIPSSENSDSILASVDSSLKGGSSAELIPVEEVLISLNAMLPLRLYFDNDYPDPKTRRTKTSSSYENLVSNYLLKLPEYQAAFPEKKDQNRIEIFFNDSVSANYNKLETFTVMVSTLLKQGTQLNLRVQGCASPLADNSYNVTLSKRRISSLLNFWNQWNEGALKSFLDQGNLILTEDAAGESLAPQMVNDQLKNKSASVYSPEAATERRIEVTEITLKQP